MSILEVIRNANEGTLLTSLAQFTGIANAEQILQDLVPQIAGKIRDKADNDADDHEQLFKVLDDEEQQFYLQDPDWSFSAGAIEDGEDILAHLYDADDLPPAPEGISQPEWEKLRALAATYTVAAIANRNQSMMMAAMSGDDASSSVWSMLIDAIIKGIMRAIRDATRPRRRARRRTRRSYGRRRSYRRRRSTKTRRRRTRRTRRRKKPDLTDLIGDLIRG